MEVKFDTIVKVVTQRSNVEVSVLFEGMEEHDTPITIGINPNGWKLDAAGNRLQEFFITMNGIPYQAIRTEQFASNNITLKLVSLGSP